MEWYYNYTYIYIYIIDFRGGVSYYSDEEVMIDIRV